MEFFDYFVTAAILIILAMISYTVWTVMKAREASSPSFHNQAFPVRQKRNEEYRGKACWRVYAIDSEFNCFTGSEIILDRKEDQFVMGRAESCDLRLMRREIGRRHAMITRSGTEYTYYDLDSKAGSVCEGKRIRSKRLEPMMVVWINDVALVFADRDVPQDFFIRAVKASQAKLREK